MDTPKKRYYAVGINRMKRPAHATVNPDCGFDPRKAPAEGQVSQDYGEWVVSQGFEAEFEAKIMAALGQRALKGSQDFFVMEHTDGVPTGYYALPRICTDDQLDNAIVAAIQNMPDDIMRKATKLHEDGHTTPEAVPNFGPAPTPTPGPKVLFIGRRNTTQQ